MGYCPRCSWHGHQAPGDGVHKVFDDGSLPECACSGVCVHVRRTAHAFITSARPSSVGVHCNGTTLHFLSSVNGYVSLRVADTDPMQDTAACLFSNIKGHNFNIIGNCVEQFRYVVPHQAPLDLIQLCTKFLSTGVWNSQNLLEIMPHNPYACSLDEGNYKAPDLTTKNVHMSECLEMHQPWPPPAFALVPENSIGQRPMPWPSFSFPLVSMLIRASYLPLIYRLNMETEFKFRLLIGQSLLHGDICAYLYVAIMEWTMDRMLIGTAEIDQHWNHGMFCVSYLPVWPSSMLVLGYQTSKKRKAIICDIG